MDQAIKRKWVKALRSGKYKQAQEYLFTGKGYCCLGVLGDVIGVPKKDMHYVGEPDDCDNYPMTVLPVDIQNEFMLLNDTKNSEIDMADGTVYELKEPVPFDMIAGLIDEAL